MPVQGQRAIIGALMLSSKAGEIDRIVGNERRAVLELFAIALAVSVLTSLLLASLLTEPVRKLAAATRGFGRRDLPSPDIIPDLSARGDEIGDLSVALRDMTRRLLERIDTIDNFAADVAHELKNPLTSLHSAVRTLDGARDDSERRELMAIVEHDVRRLNRLIDDIAEATRLDAALDMGTHETFDLAALAREMGDAFEGVEAVASTACPVSAQRDRIARIIDNLVANALSFTPTGGLVRLEVDASDPACAILRVADDGPGVPPEMRERIFERFHTDRPHAPDGDTGDHSGLGLSISRRIARAHGGDLTADDRADGAGGACFTLTLPRTPRAPKA